MRQSWLFYILRAWFALVLIILLMGFTFIGLAKIFAIVMQICS